MGSKIKLPGDQLTALTALLVEEAGRPLDELEVPAELLVLDLETTPLSPAPTGIGMVSKDTLPPCGTHPVSLRLPVTTIRAFKAKAARTGARYQTLMIRSLQAAAAMAHD